MSDRTSSRYFEFLKQYLLIYLQKEEEVYHNRERRRRENENRLFFFDNLLNKEVKQLPGIDLFCLFDIIHQKKHLCVFLKTREDIDWIDNEYVHGRCVEKTFNWNV